MQTDLSTWPSPYLTFPDDPPEIDEPFDDEEEEIVEDWKNE